MSNWQTMQPVSRVYTLPRCVVSLYQDGGDNLLGTLVWTAAQVDDLKVHESFVEVKEFLTGIPYPNIHHTSEEHTIQFDAVWNVSASLRRNTSHILVVTWSDATVASAAKGWVRRFYHGVTTSSRDISSRDGNEFGSSNSLTAQNYSEFSGTGTPATLTAGSATY